MRYILLERISKVKLTLKWIIWSKRPKTAKKHIFSLKMCVLNPNFGNKVTSINLHYRNSMRYSILSEIIRAKHTLKWIIWSKRPKTAKKHIFSIKMCALNPNFGNKVTSINLYYRNSLRYSILGEIIQVKHTLKWIILLKRPKNAKKTVKKRVFSFSEEDHVT